MGWDMNKERRKALDKMQDEFKAHGLALNTFLSSWHETATSMREDLEALKSEEEEYRDNMPENMQQSERYSNADEAVNALDEALSELDDKLGELEPFATDDDVFSGVFDHIEEAKGQG